MQTEQRGSDSVETLYKIKVPCKVTSPQRLPSSAQPTTPYRSPINKVKILVICDENSHIENDRILQYFLSTLYARSRDCETIISYASADSVNLLKSVKFEIVFVHITLVRKYSFK